MSEKRKPPHYAFKINTLIEQGEFDEAQAACDENVEWYEAKAAEYRDLYIEAEREKIRSSFTG